jgi:hypothetical protein
VSPLLHDDSAESAGYVFDAFWHAFDDVVVRRDVAPTLPEAAMVAGALGVMAHLDHDRLDPRSLADDDRRWDATRAFAASCAVHLPLVAAKVPALAPVLKPFTALGPAFEAALDGDRVEPIDERVLDRLPASVFAVPAIRTYLVRYFDARLPGIEDGASMAAAFWLCLRFMPWYRPTAFHRKVLGDYARRTDHPTWCGPSIRKAWRKIKDAAETA